MECIFAHDLDPQNFHAKTGMSIILFRQGKFEESASWMREILQKKSDAWEVRNKLAWILATNEKLRAKHSTEAVQLASELCLELRHENPVALDTLAVAYGAAGKFDNAIAMAQSALEWANKQDHNEDLVKTIKRHLEIFQRKEKVNSMGQQFPNRNGFAFRMEPVW
jgi:Flp pilus assembly protein TadD